VKSAADYMDLRAATPARQPVSADEPTTLVDVFTRVARTHKRPDTLNYKSGGRWVSMSSDEMLARAKSIAAGLHAIGVRSGDRVALLSESRVEWTLTDAGSIFAGAIDVPIYPTLTPPQVRYILNDSGACVLFLANREKFLEIKDALGECPEVKQIVFFEADGITADEGMTLAQLEEKGRELEQKDPGHVERAAAQISPDQLATIIYTSGTTGEPKGVMLTH
jgi:long-chain acyl-CoA synthetase